MSSSERHEDQATTTAASDTPRTDAADAKTRSYDGDYPCVDYGAVLRLCQRLERENAEMLNALQLVAAHYPHWASCFSPLQIDNDTIALVRAVISKATENK